jgi:cell wall-associated NlpC family hydrolase
MNPPTPPRWIDRLTPQASAALEAALCAWEGTPYLAGQQARGPKGGVDCVRFVCGVLDELQNKRTPVHTLPQDAALHARATAVLAMKKIITLYRPNDRVTDGTLEPGDILVTSREGGGPGHALIAGARRWTLWESTLDGVHYTGWAGITASGHRLEAVYRPADKARWGRR